MTKITNKKVYARWGGFKSLTAALNDTYVEYQMLLACNPFKYRAPHALRPTQPRKRFI